VLESAIEAIEPNEKALKKEKKYEKGKAKKRLKGVKKSPIPKVDLKGPIF
jgi:hypothetical protein